MRGGVHGISAESLVNEAQLATSGAWLRGVLPSSFACFSRIMAAACRLQVASLLPPLGGA